jgi:hypothetical protein
MLLALSIAISMPIFAVNNENEVHNLGIVTPNFTNISFVKTDLSIGSDGVAHAQTTATARNVDKIIVSMSLQQFDNGNWKVLKTWSQTTFGTESFQYNTMIVSRGFKYRVVSNIKVYLDNIIREEIINMSEEVFY